MSTRRPGVFSRGNCYWPCEGDEVVPPHVAQRIYDEAQEPKTLWLLPGGDHEFAQHDPETDARVFEWLQSARPISQRLKVEDLPVDKS